MKLLTLDCECLVDSRVASALENIKAGASPEACAQFLLEYTNLRKNLRGALIRNKHLGTRAARIVSATPATSEDGRKHQYDYWGVNAVGKFYKCDYHVVPYKIYIEWTVLNSVDEEEFTQRMRHKGSIQAIYREWKPLPKKVLYIRHRFALTPVTTFHTLVLDDSIARGMRAWGMHNYKELSESYVWEVSNIKGLLPWVCFLNLDKLGYSEAEVESIRMLDPAWEDNNDCNKFCIQVTWNIDMDIPEEDWIKDISEYLRKYPKMLSRYIKAIQ